MKIEFEGKTWQLELDEVDMLQGETIGAYTGLSIMAWYKSLFDTDALAWNKSARCLYWLMREQNGEPLPLETLNFAPVKLFEALGVALSDTPAAEAAPENPTRPGAGSAGAEPSPSPEPPAG